MLLDEPHAGAAPRLQRSRGEGRLRAIRRDGKTRLHTLYQEGCAKIRLPKTHSDALEAVVINTSGGLTGGDVLHWKIDAEENTRTVLTTQACERIYRTAGGAASVATQISVGPGARLDWLPQETILFDQSALDRRIDIDLAGDATLCALEAVILGREAMGEDAHSARLTDRWRIRRDGRLIHAEATRLDASALARQGLALLAGARAFATLIYAGADAERRLEAVRRHIPEDGEAAASFCGERLTIRALAPSGMALRKIITPLVAELSSAGTLPRLWST